MRKLCTVILVLTVLLGLLGCRRVIVTSADELTAHSWEYTSKNGTSATLEFSEDKASLRIFTASPDEGFVVEGAYSVDKNNFYITSSELLRTYEFGYEVYTDRVYVSYEENKIEFSRKAFE